MTPVEFYICASALSALVADNAPRQSIAYQQAVAENICAAANAERFDPIVLSALIMGENRNFDTAVSRPAAVGVDVGLCQLNSHHQRAKANYEQASHPYHCTRVAASILKEFKIKYGNDWRVISSYWNPSQAREGSIKAIEYYERWRRNYVHIATRFKLAEKAILSRQPFGPAVPN